jgi:hypothetical protein
MRGIANLLTLIGIILLGYTVVARFSGGTALLSFSYIPIVKDYIGGAFSEIGMLAGTACVLLLAVLAKLSD